MTLRRHQRDVVDATMHEGPVVAGRRSRVWALRLSCGHETRRVVTYAACGYPGKGSGPRALEDASPPPRTVYCHRCVYFARKDLPR